MVYTYAALLVSASRTFTFPTPLPSQTVRTSTELGKLLGDSKSVPHHGGELLPHGTLRRGRGLGEREQQQHLGQAVGDGVILGRACVPRHPV